MNREAENTHEKRTAGGATNEQRPSCTSGQPESAPGQNPRNILIVSNYFHPEITPRAQRTTELCREFARRGIGVTLVVPNKEVYRESPLHIDGVNVLFGDSDEIPARAAGRAKRLGRSLPVWMRRIILYFWNHEYFATFDRGLRRRLESMRGDFDALLSISYPASVHRAVMDAFRANPGLKARVKAAEFSDPPLQGEYNRRFFPAYKKFLRRAGQFFNWFVIPVTGAMPCYTPYKPESRIAVIPQGFDNSGIKLRPYAPHERPTFAYAGRFYRNTRDPRPLFDYLARLERDFSLTLYLTHCEPYFQDMIAELASRARGEINVRRALPRKELINELSAMDFLINHDYTYSTATPSKLIDYALTGRPVFSFAGGDFDPAAFSRFLDGDYSRALPLPPAGDYDIRTVAGSFLRIFEG